MRFDNEEFNGADLTAVFGGVSDKTLHRNKENPHIIYINSTTVFGGVDIK